MSDCEHGQQGGSWGACYCDADRIRKLRKQPGHCPVCAALLIGGVSGKCPNPKSHHDYIERVLG